MAWARKKEVSRNRWQLDANVVRHKGCLSAMQLLHWDWSLFTIQIAPWPDRQNEGLTQQPNTFEKRATAKLNGTVDIRPDKNARLLICSRNFKVYRLDCPFFMYINDFSMAIIAAAFICLSYARITHEYFVYINLTFYFITCAVVICLTTTMYNFKYICGQLTISFCK